MAFYTYSQNNSGGGFDYDPETGISHYVIVEADSARDADSRAERIGLYFDGEDDCPCCGDRWNCASTYSREEFPSIYGQPIAEYERDESYHWIKTGYNVFIHFQNGTIQGAVPGPDTEKALGK